MPSASCGGGDTGESWIGSYSASPIRNAEGVIVGTVVTRRDITAHKTAEQQLKRSETRFRLLSETAAQLLSADNPQNAIHHLAVKVMQHLECQVYFNFMVDDAAGRLKLNAFAGVSPETAKSLEYIDLGASVCGSVARDCRRIVAADILNADDPKTEPFQRFDLQAYCSHPLMAQGKCLGTLSFGSKTKPNFTPDEIDLMRTVADQVAIALQRVQAKELLEKTVRERTARLSMANQELEGRARQLRVLAGELTMAEQRERKRLAQVLHDGLQQYIAAAKIQVAGLTGSCSEEGSKAVEHIEQLLHDAIQMSRSLSADLSPPVLYKDGLAAGIEWLARMMRERHGLTVTCVNTALPELPDDMKVLIFESTRELLFNAAKHSGVGQAEVCTELQEGLLRIRVRDAGNGFDPKASASGEHGGGLGLFSIRERLALLGGELKIDSALGRGSCFTITVPFAPDRFGNREPAPQNERSINVLLVDDHVLFRDGMARLCKREADLKVIGQAGSGEEAIALAKEFKPDVVLMDINMPGMGGIEATRIIFRENPRIKIIGLSMYEDQHSIQNMRQAGAVDYRTKGVAAAELLAAIRACKA